MVGGLLSLTLVMERVRERVRILAGVAASGLLVWSSAAAAAAAGGRGISRAVV